MDAGSCEFSKINKIKVNDSRLKVCFNGFRMEAAGKSCLIEVGRVIALKN